MKSLCITGNLQSVLNRILAGLQKAGLEPAQASTRSPALTLADWHAQVLSAMPRAEGVSSRVPAADFQPGKFWDQVASDLFLANYPSAAWGWADARSTELLDYWQQFDPQLYFVLAYSTPQQVLADALVARGLGDSSSCDTAMQIWYRHSRELLRFHLRNPQRSILVYAQECMAYPHGLMSHLIQHWHFPLDCAGQEQRTPNETDHLALYLADSIFTRYPECSALNQEIEAVILRLNPDQTESSFPDSRSTLDRALLHYQETLNQLASSSIDRQALLSELRAAQDLHAQEKSELEINAQRQLDALATALDQQTSLAHDYETALSRVTVERDEAGQDAELLLLQLHQVQEELEYYFLECQKLKQEIPEQRRREEEFAGQQNALALAESRVQRLLLRLPGRFDYGALRLEEIDSSEGQQRLRGYIQDLLAPGVECPALHFKLIWDNGFAGIVWLRSDQPEILLLPYFTPATARQRAEALLALSKDDWILLQTLLDLLIATVFDHPSRTERCDTDDSNADRAVGASNLPISPVPAGIDIPLWRVALQRSLAALRQFPLTLRFDRALLKCELTNPDYECLWFRVENLSFGEALWPDFEFRIACADAASNGFGLHAKLEFPQPSEQTPFEQWFEESHDEFGGKLELRFALPEAMDMMVWNRLTVSDQAFLTALIVRLPSIIDAAVSNDAAIRRSLTEWQQLAKNISRIFAIRTELPDQAKSSEKTPVHSA